MNRPALGPKTFGYIENFETSGLEHFARGRGHFACHLSLVVAKAIVIPKHRDSPPILHGRIKIDIVLVTRQHFTKSAHTNEGAGLLANRLLERRPKARSRESMTGEHFRS